MEPRTKSRKKVAAAGRVSRKGVQGKARTGSTRQITYEEAQQFLHALAEWWIHLGGDVAEIEGLLCGMQPGDVLSGAEADAFEQVVKDTRRISLCPYPGGPPHRC